MGSPFGGQRTIQEVDRLLIPEALDLTFEGFPIEAFSILERLRLHPHIEQYREQKPGIRQHLVEPFKRYRDDLVVNWVLPNHLPFETERNVFSRLLKNDFGAGGCHHHLWMAFYRTGRRRLTDVQLSHTITPDGFEVGLYVGSGMRTLLGQARQNIASAPDVFLSLINALLPAYALRYRYGTGSKRTKRVVEGPLGAVPEDVSRADALWLRRRFERRDVLAWRGALVGRAVAALGDLWPLYQFFLTTEPRHRT